MANIEIVKETIPISQIQKLAEDSFGDMVKIVVDVEQGIIAAGGELHADEEEQLLRQGSKQKNLWGVNIYINEPRENWLKYDSMVNIRPSQGNLSRILQNEDMRNRIAQIVNKLIQ